MTTPESGLQQLANDVGLPPGADLADPYIAQALWDFKARRDAAYAEYEQEVRENDARTAAVMGSATRTIREHQRAVLHFNRQVSRPTLGSRHVCRGTTRQRRSRRTVQTVGSGSSDDGPSGPGSRALVGGAA